MTQALSLSRPLLRAPLHACDCHMHIYDRRFPYMPSAQLRPPAATVNDYRSLQQRLGITRVIVVQPSTYGTDNRCALEAASQFGNDARAVVVIARDTPVAELREMHQQGARGIRLNLLRGTAEEDSLLEELALRIAPLGWHLQLHTSAAAIAGKLQRLLQLPVPLVLDHMGRVFEGTGVHHEAFDAMRRLMAAGRTWVKLSGAYLDSASGAPEYADVAPLAQSLMAEAPERLVWGSDWPHPSASAGERPMPDDANLLDLLGAWATDDALHRKILVDNPSMLYGFT